MRSFNHTQETKDRLAAGMRGKPKTAAHNRAVSEGWKRRMANGGESPHGTSARYKNAHCRCDECRAAWHGCKRARKAARS
jgi:hypothetical protein